jgi:integrase
VALRRFQTFIRTGSAQTADHTAGRATGLTGVAGGPNGLLLQLLTRCQQPPLLIRPTHPKGLKTTLKSTAFQAHHTPARLDDVTLHQLASGIARLRARAESFAPVEPAHYVFAAFVPKFTFSGKKVVGYNVTEFDPTTHVNSWRTAWRTLTKKAGLPGFRFHDLRHCAITSLAESGAADSTIMAIAGHVSRKMLERYSHVRMEAKRTAMETLANSSRMGVMTQTMT